jgi:hypothetical protein
MHSARVWVFSDLPAFFFVVLGMLALFFDIYWTRDTFTGCRVGRMGPRLSFLIYVNAFRSSTPSSTFLGVFGPVPALCVFCMVFFHFLCVIYAPVTFVRAVMWVV